MTERMKAVLNALNSGNIPAIRAYPAKRMQMPDGITATVQLKLLDEAAGMETVLVNIFAPVSVGAAACEDAALQACGLLKATGCTCRVEECQHRKDMDMFCVCVLAEFVDKEVPEQSVE